MCIHLPTFHLDRAFLRAATRVCVRNKEMGIVNTGLERGEFSILFFSATLEYVLYGRFPFRAYSR